jgi:hypothetical protein
MKMSKVNKTFKSEVSKETIFLLRLLALSSLNIRRGKYKPVKKAFRDVRSKLKSDN